MVPFLNLELPLRGSATPKGPEQEETLTIIMYIYSALGCSGYFSFILHINLVIPLDAYLKPRKSFMKDQESAGINITVRGNTLIHERLVDPLARAMIPFFLVAQSQWSLLFLLGTLPFLFLSLQLGSTSLTQTQYTFS